MPSAATPVATRIPAWRRLGLKLKSSQAPDETSKPSVETDLLKRRSTDSLEQPPAKKIKTESKDQLLRAEELITPNLVRKKSVTFTPETKVEGESIKQLFSAWVAEQKEQDPAFQSKPNQAFATPEPPQVEGQVKTALSEKERRVKRVKVKQVAQKTEESPSTPKQRKSKLPKPSKIVKPSKAPSTRPFLEYIRQYHESRDTWKFNKNHQNHFLKHIFNVAIIPSDYAHFIYEYVRGLQGGVRTRLRDEALAIKVKDLEDVPVGISEGMSELDKARVKEEEKRQREYEAAMQEYVATMTLAKASSKMGYEEGVLSNLSGYAMKERMAKRMRSEQILKELGTPQEGNMEADLKRETDVPPEVKMSYSDNDSQKRLRMNDGSSQKVARKRKQRTAAADDNSSSSEDSSDSESSTDTDSETPPQRRARVETSSSSSSSSSSESDDENDDNDDDTSEEDSDDDESD